MFTIILMITIQKEAERSKLSLMTRLLILILIKNFKRRSKIYFLDAEN